MNTVMKKIINALLDSKPQNAKEIASTFPPRYGSKLLNANGNLTEFGLYKALEYPFPRKLGKLLTNCLVNKDNVIHLASEFYNYITIFRLVNTSTNTLSNFAIIKAIQSMSILHQCEFLGIQLETIKINESSNCRVELQVADYYKNLGNQSINLEGGDIFVLLRAAAWEQLSKLYSCKSTPYLEAMLIDIDDPSKTDSDAVAALLDGIESSTLDNTIMNFKKVYFSTPLEGVFPKITIKYISSLYEAIGLESLYKIGKLFSTDPYLYRKGWPDINVISYDNKLYFREVKVNDKLLPSQINVFQALTTIFNDIGVVKVSYE